MKPEFKHSIQSILGKEILFRTYKGILTADKEIQMLQYALEEGLLHDQIIHPLLGAIYNEKIHVRPFSTRQAAIQYIITS